MNFGDILSRWNLWGNWEAQLGFPRPMTHRVNKTMDEPEVIALIGPRRSGKSTVMYQLMMGLLQKGVPRQAIFHMNFEEPGLSPYLNISLLDVLYDDYRRRVYPKGTAYIFLDEIQNIPEWERWVRARNESENIKIVLTGSSANLMSRELGTLLTGRHFTFTIYPFSFKEILSIKNIKIPEHGGFRGTPEIQYVLDEYMRWGGFPRVVLAKDEEIKNHLLSTYFEDILYKDIIARHEIRDVRTLKNLAIHLLTNTAGISSSKRLANLLSVSSDLTKSYCQYLTESFMIEFVPAYSVKVGERTRSGSKFHTIDLGLRKTVSVSQTQDLGKLTESIVYQRLLQSNAGEIYFYNDGFEIDFLVKQGNVITRLIQVVAENMEDPRVYEREIKALEKGGKHFPSAKRILIARNMPEDIRKKIGSDIEVISLWEFLCAE